MMPYIIILKVRKFHQPTANRFSTAKKKPMGAMNRVKLGIILNAGGIQRFLFFDDFTKPWPLKGKQKKR